MSMGPRSEYKLTKPTTRKLHILTRRAFIDIESSLAINEIIEHLKVVKIELHNSIAIKQM